MSPFTVQAFLFQVHTALGPFRDMKMIFTLSSYCSKQINKTNALFIFSMNRQEAKEHTGAHGFSLPSGTDGKAWEGVHGFPPSLSSPSRTDCSQALISVVQRLLPSGLPLHREY